MTFCCDGSGPGIGTHSFHELLKQLVQAHDAEVAYWKSCVEVPLNNEPVGQTVEKHRPIPKMSEHNEVVALGDPEDVFEFYQPTRPSLPEPSPPSDSGGVHLDAQDGVPDEIMRRTLTGGRVPFEGRLLPEEQLLQTWTDRFETRETLVELAQATEEPEATLHYSKFDYLTYVIDGWISRRRSQAVALLLTFMTAVFIFGLMWTACFASAHLTWYENFLEGFWIAWTFMADPGTHSDVTGQPRRLVGGTFAAVGIIFMAATLGMIVDVIREKMDALRKGKTNVVEQGHSLILGWTEKAVSIIEELCFANESEGGGTIVVLTRIDKESIERDFATQLKVKDRRGTRVVFRCGNPMVITDLMKVGAPTARATIILGNDGDPDNSDAEVLRVMLNLRTLPFKPEGHIVCEVRDIDNEPLVKMVGGDFAETLVSHDILGRLMLTSARQPGLAKVYESLLGFQGDEFYISEWPELIGIPFGCLIERFPDAIPIGVFTEYENLELNPDWERVIEKGEKILVIAEDDDTYKPEDPEEIEEGQAPAINEAKSLPSKILFCGWRRDVRDIVNHLDKTLKPGSEIHMITGHVPLSRREELLLDEGLDVSTLKRVTLKQHYGNPSVRRRLSMLPLSSYTSCMIFADQAFESDTMQADSHSLATLLLLRDLQMNIIGKESKKRPTVIMRDDSGKQRIDTLSNVVQSCPVICEVLDPRTQSLINGNAYLKRSAEFCQTNKITAQMLAMVAESHSVNVLFDEILGVGGNGVNVYPATRYVSINEKVSFWMVAKRASKQREVLIGYMDKNDHRVFMNPPKKHHLRYWEGLDIILIAQEVSDDGDFGNDANTRGNSISTTSSFYLSSARNGNYMEV